MKLLAAAAALLAAVALPGAAVLADDVAQDAFAKAPAALPLSDATLGDQHGRLVFAGPPVTATAIRLLPSQAPAGSASAASSPSAKIATPPGLSGASGGQIVYFGFDLSSAWTTHGKGGSTTFAVGENVGIDLGGAQPSVSISTWSSRSGNGAAPAASGTVSGSVADGRIAGVGQTIQIAGDGNVVANGATIDVSSVRPTFVVTTSGGAACGSACKVATGSSGIGVAINLPGGSVSQGLQDGSLYQTVQVTSDANAIANQMKLSLQVAPGTARTSVSPALNILPSTLQIVR